MSLEILMTELKEMVKRQRKANPSPSDGSNSIISKLDFLVKSNERKIPSGPIIDLTKEQGGDKVVGTAINGRLVIGKKSELEIRKRWIAVREDSKEAKEKRRKENQRILKLLGLGKHNVISLNRTPALALVINFEAYRQNKSETKSRAEQDNNRTT